MIGTFVPYNILQVAYKCRCKDSRSRLIQTVDCDDVQKSAACYAMSCLLLLQKSSMLPLDQTAFAKSPILSSTKAMRYSERRSSMRIAIPFRTIVRGVHVCGQPFEERGHLDNLSGMGLYVHLGQPVMPGSLLFVVVRFVLDDMAQTFGPGVAIRGTVLRCELRPDNRWGIALIFFRHRFLFVDSMSMS